MLKRWRHLPPVEPVAMRHREQPVGVSWLTAVVDRERRLVWPSAAMAAVARRACADHPGVLIEVDDFENWDASGRTFPLVFAAQSWHWVQAPVGFAKAARVLTTRGLLAAFWNRPAWPEARAREALAAAYRQAAPLLDAADDPMHPDYRFEVGDEDWVEPVARTDGLSEPEVRCYPSMQMYSSDAYVRLLTTHSAVRLMPDGHRTALLDAVACAIALQGAPLSYRCAPGSASLGGARRSPRDWSVSCRDPQTVTARSLLLLAKFSLRRPSRPDLCCVDSKGFDSRTAVIDGLCPSSRVPSKRRLRDNRFGRGRGV